MKKYFVTDPGSSPHGPYDETMVKRAFEHGMYPPGTKVWWEGCVDWTPIESVFGKAEANEVPPPHAPAPSSSEAPHSPHHRPVNAVAGWDVINAFISNMKRYAHFGGRSCKSEYWYFTLAQVIVFIPLAFFELSHEEPIPTCFGKPIYTVVSFMMTIALLLPNMAICYRRLQDAGYKGTAAAILSGIFDLTSLVSDNLSVDTYLNLVFLIVLGCLPTLNENNPYGAEPLRPI